MVTALLTPGNKMSGKPNIRPLEKKDFDSLSHLFHIAFNRTRTNRHWEWKFFDNPHGAPVATVAEKDDEIIGFYGLLPRKVRWAGEETTAYQEVDLMVHPEHGSGGLFKVLGRASYDRVIERGHPFTFGFPNQTSLPLGRRILGWRVIKPIPLWTVLLKPAEALKGKLPSVPGMSVVAKLGLTAYHSARLKGSTRGGVTESSEVSESILSGLTQQNSETEFIRDIPYMQWRYVNHPDVDYRIYTAVIDEQPQGFAVAGSDKSGQMHLAEFNVSNNSVKTCKGLIRQILKGSSSCFDGPKPASRI